MRIMYIFSLFIMFIALGCSKDSAIYGTWATKETPFVNYDFYPDKTGKYISTYENNPHMLDFTWEKTDGNNIKINIVGKEYILKFGGGKFKDAFYNFEFVLSPNQDRSKAALLKLKRDREIIYSSQRSAMLAKEAAEKADDLRRDLRGKMDDMEMQKILGN
jgi:hypothetical protein